VLDSWREKTVLGEERKHLSAGCLVANIRRVSALLIIGSCNNEINVNVLVVLQVFVIVHVCPAQSTLNMRSSAFSSSLRIQRNLHHRKRAAASSSPDESAFHTTPQTLPKIKARGMGP
jgi:hypothetical protein